MAQDTSGINDQDKLMAALAYPIWLIVPLIILLTDSKNRAFQRYHAIQSLGLSGVYFVGTIVLCVVTIIPVIGQAIGCLTPLYWLAALILSLYYAYRAYKGEYFTIPYLTEFMKQQKWL